MPAKAPWTQQQATEEIRAIARSPRLALSYKLHARERLTERGIIMSDVLYVLKNGFVHTDAVPAGLPDHDCYRMESRSPNSGTRILGVVVIPDKRGWLLKIVTVMWIDEKERRAGTIMGEDDD